MNSDVKRALTKRKFRSVEYIEELSFSVGAARKQLIESLGYLYLLAPKEKWRHGWNLSDWPETWEEKVLQTLSSYDDGVKSALRQYKKNGDRVAIDGWASNISNIFRNMDVVGWKWWDFIPKDFRKDFEVSLVKASKIGANITRELSGHWRHPDSVLDEEITGPIDEVELKRYLMPGESV